MQKPKYQNSAGRLLAVFSSLPSQGSPNTYKQMLAGHIGIEANKGYPLRSTFAAIALLQTCFDEFWADVDTAPALSQLSSLLRESLKGLTASAYPSNLDQQFPKPSSSEVGMIEVAARLLPQDQELDQDDIARIRESISDLRSLIFNGGISPSLKAILLDLIRLSEDALAHYDIRGARGLKKAFVAMLGETQMLYTTETKVGRQDELKKSGVWSAIQKHLQIVDLMLAKVQQYQPLIETGAQYFLGGPPTS
jgi:hypothetical protein